MGFFKHHWWSSMDDNNDGCQNSVWIILVHSAVHNPSVGLNHYLDYLTNLNWLVTGLSSPWLVTGMTGKNHKHTKNSWEICYSWENKHYFYGNGSYVVNCKRDYQAGCHQMVGWSSKWLTFTIELWTVIPVISQKLNEYCYPLTTLASWLVTCIYIKISLISYIF